MNDDLFGTGMDDDGVTDCVIMEEIEKGKKTQAGNGGGCLGILILAVLPSLLFFI